MIDSQLPITKDSEVCQVLTCLPEKFIVDFANGIDVTRDHIRVQRGRTSFFDRCYDGFTGSGVRRQNEINASLADGVEGALNWLTELTASIASSNYAIVQVSRRVGMIQDCVAKIANYSADTRQQLQTLAFHLEERCLLLDQEINRIGSEQVAERQLGQVFNKWSAGHFNKFSLAGRCYAAIEELRWGDFGDYCRKHDNKTRHGFLNDLTNRAITQLSADADAVCCDRRDVLHWINKSSDCATLLDTDEALTYLGDWSREEFHPFVFSTTQKTSELPQKLPRVCTVERVANAFVSEIFRGDTNE